MRLRPVIVVILTLYAGVSQRDISAQTLLDRAVVRVTGGVETVVTQLDIREARLLKLVDAAATDDAIADALVDRRLMLADIVRLTDLDPTEAALDARRAQWRDSLGPSVDLAAILARTGMTDAALTNWLRDDVRLQTYIGRRLLVNAQPTVADQQRYYREHSEEFTRDGILAPFDAVKDVIAATLGSTNRASAISRWIDSLRRRVDVTQIK